MLTYAEAMKLDIEAGYIVMNTVRIEAENISFANIQSIVPLALPNPIQALLFVAMSEKVLAVTCKKPEMAYLDFAICMEKAAQAISEIREANAETVAQALIDNVAMPKNH